MVLHSLSCPSILENFQNLRESRTIRCVALSDFVTEMPKKLKKAIETMFPINTRARIGELEICCVNTFRPHA
eukprot:749263-Hanusia_phi.AAC.3